VARAPSRGPRPLLIEEQHAVVREHDLADRIASRAADQTRRGDRVMRRAPRPLADKLAGDRFDDAADARHVDRLRPA
jgi:hypothetical protein